MNLRLLTATLLRDECIACTMQVFDFQPALSSGFTELGVPMKLRMVTATLLRDERIACTMQLFDFQPAHSSGSARHGHA